MYLDVVFSSAGGYTLRWKPCRALENRPSREPIFKVFLGSHKLKAPLCSAVPC